MFNIGDEVRIIQKATPPHWDTSGRMERLMKEGTIGKVRSKSAGIRERGSIVCGNPAGECGYYRTGDPGERSAG